MTAGPPATSTTIPTPDLEVGRLCLGGNVFGWTADEHESFAVLDAFRAIGGRFVDTADVYSEWAVGNHGGESETILGRWLASRGRRDLVVATKVGKLPGMRTLDAATITRAADDSLRRLGVDVIDLYYAHDDDRSTPLAETLAAFDALVRAGKVRAIAASNITAPRLAAALAASDEHGLTRYVAVQPPFHLLARDDYEGPLQGLVVADDLACFPYSALADGFLTGKYRPDVPPVAGQRLADVQEFFTDRGWGVVAALDAVAIDLAVPMASVALAWSMAQPGVTAPIASARTVAQVEAMAPALSLTLTPAQLHHLDDASRAG
jgi:aryl-alcohol dehydrogenase-like predicted oxidoreductase